MEERHCPPVYTKPVNAIRGRMTLNASHYSYDKHTLQDQSTSTERSLCLPRIGLLHPRLSLAGEQDRTPARILHVAMQEEAALTVLAFIVSFQHTNKPGDVFHPPSLVMSGICPRVKRP